MKPEQYKRRKQAAEYLKVKYGHGSPKTLAKLACIGGGPEMVYAGSIPLYTDEALDAWASAKLSVPVRSTSEQRRPARAAEPNPALSLA